MTKSECRFPGILAAAYIVVDVNNRLMPLLTEAQRQEWAELFIQEVERWRRARAKAQAAMVEKKARRGKEASRQLATTPEDVEASPAPAYLNA